MADSYEFLKAHYDRIVAAREVEAVAKFAASKSGQFTQQAFGDSRVEDAANALEDIALMLRELPAVSREGWQTIDTAPPTGGHGLHVLLYVPRFGLGSLIVEGWVNAAINGSPWVAHNGGQIEPTHWQILPDPPASVSPPSEGQ